MHESNPFASKKLDSKLRSRLPIDAGVAGYRTWSSSLLETTSDTLGPKPERQTRVSH